MNAEPESSRTIEGSPCVTSVQLSTRTSENESWSKLGIKWLEVLEAKFDKNLLELELAFSKCSVSPSEDQTSDPDKDQIEECSRRPSHLAQLSATFVQLSHKCLLLCDANTGFERELHQVRKQLQETAARNRRLEQQLNQRNVAAAGDWANLNQSDRSLASSMSFNSKSIGLQSTAKVSAPIKVASRSVEDEHEIRNLRVENYWLRKQLSYVKSDLFGAQLAAKYLDKELSGRIQQIQVLS
jgi:hypothetical protein